MHDTPPFQSDPPAPVPAEMPERRRALAGLRAFVRRWTAAAFWSAIALCFLLALGVLALRHAVLPQADAYREELAQALSDKLGRRVGIGALAAQWQGLRPGLDIRDLTLHDAAGRPALQLERVSALLSWTSLLAWDLRLARLEIAGPRLDVRREADGRIFVAGLALDEGPQGGGLGDWLLAQPQVLVRDARVEWTDLKRAAPALALTGVNLRLENRGRRHRFGLTAAPPADLSAPLDLRGDFRGASLKRLGEWQGQAYAELEYADLAVWRQWLDYPLELARGSGGLRLWLGVDNGRVDALAADLALADAALRLAPELPVLDLAQLSGRVTLRLPESGFELATRGLRLLTREGIAIAPTDMQLRFAPAAARGGLVADHLDLQALTRLAAHLPLEAGLREEIAALAPRGRLDDLSLSWEASGEGALPARYALKARFEGLGLNARGHLPGVEGLSGSIEGNERGGIATLASRRAALAMPAVFADPLLPLEELAAKASWTVGAAGVEVNLHNMSFQNADARGTAAGHFRSRAEGPGEIDLSAHLARAKGDAVWRYMPLAVNQRVRDWLRASIVGGVADDARLRLKGDLKDWPFVPGRPGVFQVSARFAGANLRYAEGWPDIVGVEGQLLFDGVRMLITGRKARIYDVALSNVTAEIEDLNAWEELLVVKGSAAGPTASFLRFIDASPVARRIDHFTEGMKASGAGSLSLKLVLPLRKLEDSQVEGDYRFINNTLEPDPAMPPLTEANARLQFTGSGLTVQNASARLLGSPVRLDVATRGDGLVQIGAQGTATLPALRKFLGAPALDHLSGSASWRGDFSVRRRQMDMLIESDLVGVASALPPPFAKAAAETLPLRLERQVAGADARGVLRETYRLSVGPLASAELVRRREAGASVLERGAVGIGRKPELPESGLALLVELPSLDVDPWRRLAAGAGEADGPGFDALALKARELHAFGHSLSELELRARLADGSWLGQIASKELSGELLWNSRGKGRLRARLKQLALGEAQPSAPAAAGAPAAETRELPALNVSAEDFSLRGKHLGRLELAAVDRGNTWRIDKLAITNPEASFTAQGQWRVGGAAAGGSQTQLDFRLDSSDVGKLLDRLGYADTVRRGSAQLEGKLSWQGAPTALDYASLDGSLEVQAAKGQFNKLEPGVGRLLGILSLQALPRRVSLDFRDVFSEGFAFDSISGSIKVRRGHMNTDKLHIQGPAAKVTMSGSVDLERETQDLKVRVQPAIGESVAVGAALVNPVVGVATLLAQKILRDPLDQMFAYEYAVTGGWADPKVEKVAPPQASATKEP